MDRSSRSGGNVGNALFAFSKEEENPRSWFWGFSSSGISTAGWIYETLIAGLDHPCSFRFTHKFCYRAIKRKGNLQQHWLPDTSRIRQELGYREEVELEQALKATIA